MKTLLCVVILIVASWGEAKSACKESYVPPHSTEEAVAVKDWAVAGAIAIYAKHFGVAFDRESFMNDCPNLALFNFGRITGTSCVDVDVMGGYASALWVLDNYYRKFRQGEMTVEEFENFFLDKVVEFGASEYIKATEVAYTPTH